MTGDFRSLALSSDLLAVLAELGFDKLTPVQAESIPWLLQGRDLIGQSKTGSGKTAAFALPMLHRLDVQKRVLKGLVLCPTRELSAQVAREIRKLGRRHRGLQVLVLSGGEPSRPQAHALDRGAHLAVGTPGRILDHLRREVLDLSRIDTIVLDEADRMLEMGFQEDIEEILLAAPARRQTVLFSATYPRSIESMSAAFQREPLRITIEDDSERPDIAQRFVTARAEQKLRALRWLLAHHPHQSALVFCNFKASVSDLEDTLAELGMSVAGLHGDLEQYDRDQVMAKFRNGSTRILIATDVAARGIDVQDLDLVINYDLPSQPAVYVHRIGRTGRAGKTGLAISIATERESAKLHAIEALTGSKIEPIPMIGSEGDSPEGASQREEPAREAKMDTLQISGGRREKVRPGDILGALTGEAGNLNATDIGKIEIHDHFSYVAVTRAVSEIALSRLNEGRIKGRRFRVRRVA